MKVMPSLWTQTEIAESTRQTVSGGKDGAKKKKKKMFDYFIEGNNPVLTVPELRMGQEAV